MSTSKTNSNLNESLDLDEIEQSLTNSETSNSVQQTDSNRFQSSNNVVKQTKIKTSNVPGPVGLLPILVRQQKIFFSIHFNFDFNFKKTQEDLKRLKEDKSARDALMNTEENRQVKRTKGSNDVRSKTKFFSSWKTFSFSFSVWTLTIIHRMPSLWNN